MHQIEQIKQLLDQLPSANQQKIGIGITEHNRPDMFAKCYESVIKLAPAGSTIVVVDDASTKPLPQATYRFNSNVGIAAAKNKCFELLYKAGCEHIFLLDSDTWPLSPDSWTPYIESKEPHLNYIFTHWANGKSIDGTTEIYRDNEIVAYNQPRGCMMYFNRSVLDAVGGMDEIFGKWGHEHRSLSDRIFMYGLTSFRYMDVVNSKGLWYSDDEHNENRNTTVKNHERQQYIQRNHELYEARKFSSSYQPFYKKDNILLTCYFNAVKDPQRDTNFDSSSKMLNPLIDSLKDTKLIVLHDCLSDKDTEKVKFVKVKTGINPYFQRWISYRSYLMQNKEWIGNVFCIDATDIELLKEPDWNDLGDWIYTGDEPTTFDDKGQWMRKNHPNPSILSLLNDKGKQYQMLNAGILGGNISNVLDFMRALIDFYALSDNPGVTDMGAFNYIARTVFKDKIRYGREVCTIFKGNERNDYSWFKHK